MPKKKQTPRKLTWSCGDLPLNITQEFESALKWFVNDNVVAAMVDATSQARIEWGIGKGKNCG